MMAESRFIPLSIYIYLSFHSNKLVATSQRFDGMSHWPANTDDKKRRNPKQCTLDGKRDNKTNYICSKCEIPVHVPLSFQASIFCSNEILSSNFLLGQGIIITSFYRLPFLDEIFFTFFPFFKFL